MAPVDHAEMLVDGHRILPRLLEDIESAETFVHVSMFLFFRDPVGEEIAAALSRRARAGVAVRVLVDMEKTAIADPFSTGEKEMIGEDPAVGHDPLDIEPMCEAMRAAGVAVVDTSIDYDAVPSVEDARLRRVATRLRKGIGIDEFHVDHRKIVVVDGRIAYVGGANIGAQYMYRVPFDVTKDAREEGDERKNAGLPEPWWKWHDSLTRFDGPVATAIDALFRERWVLDGGDPVTSPPRGAARATSAPAPGFPVRSARVLCNEPNAEPNEIAAAYLRLIGEARRSIFLENPYLYHPEIADALVAAKAARPELDVTLVLPSGRYNDNAYAQDAQEHEYARYLERGIAVYEYGNHFTHLKTAVFDERWSIHGSTNLNYRSLERDKDFEIVVLVDDEPFARWILEHVRDVDVRASRRIGETDVHGSIDAFRRRVRDPRTIALMARRML